MLFFFPLSNTPMDETQISNSPKIYQTAKSLFGEHLTLNPSVPSETGCAEALSAVLLKCSVKGIPRLGFAGTYDMLHWLENSPSFVEIFEYEPGAIIISATGSGNGKIPGHCGVCAQQGILSNNSDNGLWQEKWTMDKWREYYAIFGGMEARFFRNII